jgi:hypothetical protein
MEFKILPTGIEALKLFLANFRPPTFRSCVVLFSDIENFQKNYALKQLIKPRRSIFFEKMSQNILADPLPPTRDNW